MTFAGPADPEREEEREEGVSEEGEIKTEKGGTERGGLGCWQRPVVRQ